MLVSRTCCRPSSRSLDEAALVLGVHQEEDNLLHVVVAESIQSRYLGIGISAEELCCCDAKLHLREVQADTD
jgi:hypothetical protein